jgi:hypothetical protein
LKVKAEKRNSKSEIRNSLCRIWSFALWFSVFNRRTAAVSLNFTAGLERVKKTMRAQPRWCHSERSEESRSGSLFRDPV